MDDSYHLISLAFRSVCDYDLKGRLIAGLWSYRSYNSLYSHWSISGTRYYNASIYVSFIQMGRSIFLLLCFSTYIMSKSLSRVSKLQFSSFHWCKRIQLFWNQTFISFSYKVYIPRLRRSHYLLKGFQTPVDYCYQTLLQIYMKGLLGRCLFSGNSLSSKGSNKSKVRILLCQRLSFM